MSKTMKRKTDGNTRDGNKPGTSAFKTGKGSSSSIMPSSRIAVKTSFSTVERAQMLYTHLFGDFEKDEYGDKSFMELSGVNPQEIKNLVTAVLEYRLEGKGDLNSLIKKSSDLANKFEGSERLTMMVGRLLNDLVGWNEETLTKQINYLEELHIKLEEEIINAQKLREICILNYVNDLKSDEVSERKMGAILLAAEAEKGTDVSFAIPELHECLKDENKDVVAYSIAALTYLTERGVDIKRSVPRIMELLKDDDSMVRCNSCAALARVAMQKTNVSLVASDLIDLLKDDYVFTRTNAAGALKEIAGMGINIDYALPNLVNAMDDIEDSVRRNSTGAILNIARQGVDISMAVPQLKKAMKDYDDKVRIFASRALAEAT